MSGAPVSPDRFLKPEADPFPGRVQAMFTLTEAAGAKLKDLMHEHEGKQAYLRVGVQGGGCSGLSYTMYFDEEMRPDDLVRLQHGIVVVVDPKSHGFVAGTELDFSGGLDGEGFHFKNPNAARTCGCGSSFSA